MLDLDAATVRMLMRRAAATAIDYGCVAGWAGVVLGVSMLADAPRRLGQLEPLAGQAHGIVTITLPATAALAWLEAHGGTPGERMLGLRVLNQDGAPPTLLASATRTTGKVAIPWELAHAGIWRLGAGGWQPAVLVAAAYVVLGAALCAVIAGRRTWYEHLAGTTVDGG